MSYVYRSCELEMDHEAYVTFLLRHDAELNLPYPFAMKLGFLSSPLFLGKAMLVFHEESYDLAGAAGFVYGTGPRDYEDRDVCQVEVVIVRREYRRPTLFVEGLRALVAEMKAGNPDVRQVQFWTSPAHAGLERLFAKLAALPGATRSVVNDRAFYTVPFRELEAYAGRLRAG